MIVAVKAADAFLGALNGSGAVFFWLVAKMPQRQYGGTSVNPYRKVCLTSRDIKDALIAIAGKRMMPVGGCVLVRRVRRLVTTV
jgi:hypothetical protein